MPLRVLDSDDPRHTLVLHGVFFVLINAGMLVGIGAAWLWVAAAWTVGFLVHIALAVRHHRAERVEDDRV